MAVSLKIVLGTVNYTDYLRVSAAKVSDPGTEVFVEYINTPITNYTLIIPDLDPDNYYITFRDAPDTMSLGTLVSQAFVNAQTGEWEYERRFYKIGDLPSGATIDGDMKIITDPYLENKNVTGVFKEGFRYLRLGDEATHDDAAGTLEVNNELSDGEMLIVEIKYNVGSSSTTTVSGLFTDTITVEDAVYTIPSTDKYKRHCLDCTGAKQEITLPALSALANGDFVYLEHKREGVQAQSRIIPAGTDKILFNGFNLGSNELEEIFVAKGQDVYLRKEGSYWEIIHAYEGGRVGERMAGTFIGQPNFLPEDGRLLDGDEYPGLYWWIRNVLPNTHYVTDDLVTGGGYVHPAGKEGLFVIHSTLKKFRLPNTQGLYEKGLKNFTTYGADAARTYDYPGGKQNWQMGEYTDVRGNDGATSTGVGYTGGNPAVFSFKTSTVNSGKKNEVENFGVIYLRHI